MYMIIVGGGNVGLQLAKRLLSIGHEVLVVERDSQTADRIATQIGEENVTVGDGCEMATQRDCGFGRADVVIAVTGEDEDNLIVCQMAKTVWSVKRALARVNDPSHEEIFKQVGIDETVSATGIIYSMLEQQIQPDVLMPVGTLGRGDHEVVEVELSARSPAVGKTRRDLDLPEATHIVWVFREESGGHQVDDHMVFSSGDTLVAIVPRSSAEALRRALAPPAF